MNSGCSCTMQAYAAIIRKSSAGEGFMQLANGDFRQRGLDFGSLNSGERTGGPRYGISRM